MKGGIAGRIPPFAFGGIDHYQESFDPPFGFRYSWGRLLAGVGPGGIWAGSFSAAAPLLFTGGAKFKLLQNIYFFGDLRGKIWGTSREKPAIGRDVFCSALVSTRMKLETSMSPAISRAGSIK
jgi:hypothetical protein